MHCGAAVATPRSTVDTEPLLCADKECCANGVITTEEALFPRLEGLCQGPADASKNIFMLTAAKVSGPKEGQKGRSHSRSNERKEAMDIWDAGKKRGSKKEKGERLESTRKEEHCNVSWLATENRLALCLCLGNPPSASTRVR